MRVIFLSFLILTAMLASGPAHAQPAMLEAKPLLGGETTTAPSVTVTPPATLAPAPTQKTIPDLTPDTLTKPVPTITAPQAALDDGESTVVPSMEPWQSGRSKRRGGKTADQVFVTLPFDIQNQILEETRLVNAECHHYDTYSQFHNCECLGSLYFEERVFSPEESKDTIVGRISGECTSIPGVAGYGYDQCMSSMGYLLESDRIGDFCTCFANQLAQNYKMSPSPDFGNLRALTAQTNTFCLSKVPGAIKMPRRN